MNFIYDGVHLISSSLTHKIGLVLPSISLCLVFVSIWLVAHIKDYNILQYAMLNHNSEKNCRMLAIIGNLWMLNLSSAILSNSIFHLTIKICINPNCIQFKDYYCNSCTQLFVIRKSYLASLIFLIGLVNNEKTGTIIISVAEGRCVVHQIIHYTFICMCKRNIYLEKNEKRRSITAIK